MTNDHQKVATGAASDPELSRYHVLLDEEVLPRLERPGRYVGPLKARGIAARGAKITPLALLWPSLPESHNPPRSLAPWTAALEAYLRLPVETACAPPRDCERVLAQWGLRLFTCPNWIPLSRFSQLVAWIEDPVQVLGLLTILQSAGLPLRSADRKIAPRVIATGPGAAFLASLLPAWVDEIATGLSPEAFARFVEEHQGTKSQSIEAASPFLPSSRLEPENAATSSPDGENAAPVGKRAQGASAPGAHDRVRPVLPVHLQAPWEEIQERFGGARLTRLRVWGASEELRRRLGLASSEFLVEALGRALAHESRLLEVDLVVGLPGETEADRASLVLLADQLVRIAPRGGRQLSFRIHAYVDGESGGGEVASWLDAVRREFLARKLKVSISSRVEETICRALGAAGLRDAGEVETIFQAGVHHGDSDAALSAKLWEPWMRSKGLWVTAEAEGPRGEDSAATSDGKGNSASRRDGEKSSPSPAEPGPQALVPSVTGLETMSPLPASLDANGHPIEPKGEHAAVDRKDRWHRWNALVPREYQLRVSYEKRGRIRHLSHKETMEIFVEACRLGKVPLAVAGVVSPRPKLSFGPPLPAGIEGLDEFVDLSLTHKSEGIVQALREHLPVGLRVRWARYLPASDRKAHAPIQRARFRALLRARDLPLARETVERFSKAQRWEIERIKAESTLTLDLKAQVTNVDFIEREDGGAELGFDLDLADSTPSARPYEVVAALSGADADGVRTIPLRRVSLWSRGGEPMGSWKTPLELLDLSLRRSRQAVQRFA